MSRFFRLSIVTALVLVAPSVVIGGVRVNAEGLPSSANSVNSSRQLATLIAPNSAQEACKGLNLDTNSSDCANDGTSAINSLLANVINILSVIVGIVAVVMIIVGGLKFITSGGEANKIAGARNTILYALIGLVIAVLAQVLVHFVLYRANAANNAPANSTSTGAGTGGNTSCGAASPTEC